jgi:hypothetical protein
MMFDKIVLVIAYDPLEEPFPFQEMIGRVRPLFDGKKDPEVHMAIQEVAEQILHIFDDDHSFCGPTDDESVCACGCSGYDERCPLYLRHYHGIDQVPASHVCCKIPGRE